MKKVLLLLFFTLPVYADDIKLSKTVKLQQQVNLCMEQLRHVQDDRAYWQQMAEQLLKEKADESEKNKMHEILAGIHPSVD